MPRKNRVVYFYDGELILDVFLWVFRWDTCYGLNDASAREAALYKARVRLWMDGILLSMPTLDALGKVYYAPKHPMKPPRLMMTHELVVAYGLHKYMDMFVRS